MKKTYFCYRSFWPELKAMGEFRKAGVDTICFFASNTTNSLGEPYCKYPPIWLWHDVYDFAPLDRQIEDILSAVPDARLLCIVDLNTPQWLVNNWNEKEVHDSFNELGRSVCSSAWRKAVGDYLEAFLRYAESKYSSRIDAYVLSGGRTSEWMDFSRGVETAERRLAFREWCDKQGLPVPADIPPLSVREHAESLGALRDPKEDRLALDYWRFNSEIIVDAIRRFIGRARAVIPAETELGVFHGYNLELDRWRMINFGHLAYEKLLEEPGLDFLISPATYFDRAMGGGSGFMVPHGTLALKGKGFLHECDQRTHTYNAHLTPHVVFKTESWPDEKATIAGMRREMALALIRHTSLWWFDMWGGFYQGEAVFDNLREMKKLWDRLHEREAGNADEIALIVDPAGCYYLNSQSPLTTELVPRLRNKLSRVGAPFEVYSFEDIPSIPDFERYKLVVFSTPFEITERKERILRERVLKDGRSALWLHAPGVSDGKSLDPARVEKLCGAKFGSPGIVKTKMEGWTSIYVHDPLELTPAKLKELAAEAGVNIYCDAETPVYANGKLLAVHVAKGGAMSIRLPKRCSKVVELYSGETVAEDAASFSFEFESPDTRLFELEE